MLLCALSRRCGALRRRADEGVRPYARTRLRGRLQLSSVPMPPAVVVTGLVKQFGRFAALRGVTAEFAPSRLYAILGDNGAGKTTLLRALAGLTPPTRGSISMLGTDDLRSVCREAWIHGPSFVALRRNERDGEPALLRAPVRNHDERTLCRCDRAVKLDPSLTRPWANTRRACGNGCRWLALC